MSLLSIVNQFSFFVGVTLYFLDKTATALDSKLRIQKNKVSEAFKKNQFLLNF